jgi:hypothetical protein
MSQPFRDKLVKELTDKAVVVAPTLVATALFGPPAGLVVGAAVTAAILAAGGNNPSQPPVGDQKSR